jgi:HNH endonuclease
MTAEFATICKERCLREAWQRGLGTFTRHPLFAFESSLAAIFHDQRGMETAERMVVQRVGQDIFRHALVDYSNNTCPLTGIADPALLRASHIISWADCETDDLRLNVYNGLLLSSLRDAAFDAGLVGFTAGRAVLYTLI